MLINTFYLGSLLPHVLQHGIVSVLDVLEMVLPILVVHPAGQRLRHLVQVGFHLLSCSFHLRISMCGLPRISGAIELPVLHHGSKFETSL